MSVNKVPMPGYFERHQSANTFHSLREQAEYLQRKLSNCTDGMRHLYEWLPIASDEELSWFQEFSAQFLGAIEDEIEERDWEEEEELDLVSQ